MNNLVLEKFLELKNKDRNLTVSEKYVYRKNNFYKLLSQSAGQIDLINGIVNTLNSVTHKQLNTIENLISQYKHFSPLQLYNFIKQKIIMINSDNFYRNRYNAYQNCKYKVNYKALGLPLYRPIYDEITNPNCLGVTTTVIPNLPKIKQVSYSKQKMNECNLLQITRDNYIQSLSIPHQPITERYVINPTPLSEPDGLLQRLSCTSW